MVSDRLRAAIQLFRDIAEFLTFAIPFTILYGMLWAAGKLTPEQ